VISVVVKLVKAFLEALVAAYYITSSGDGRIVSLPEVLWPHVQNHLALFLKYRI